MISLKSDKIEKEKLGLGWYGIDKDDNCLTAFNICEKDYDREVTRHQHRKGQLILVLKGAVICEAENVMWLTPSQHAVWIPGDIPHANRITANASICFVFIEPDIQTMPKYCCTLKISNLVREIILTLIGRNFNQKDKKSTPMLIQVLLDELPLLITSYPHIPVSEHPKLRKMAQYMISYPASRKTQSQWAASFSMSERSLSRLIIKEVGINFRHWKQQLLLIIASRFLIEGNSVKKVSLMLGYKSTTAFITMFKSGIGMTPGYFVSRYCPKNE